MNIGIFTDTYYPEVNGVASSTYELKQGLEQMGHSVYVFTVSNPTARSDKEQNVYRISSIPFPMLRERRIGVTIYNTWKRKIQKLHLDIIHTQTEFIMGHMGRKIADYLGIPHIHTYHTIYEDYLSYLHMPDKQCFRIMAQQFSRICCNRADEIIVPTDKVRNLLKQYKVKRNVHVIPSGISLQKFAEPDRKHVDQLRDQLGIHDEKTVLLYVGRLSAEKNIAELITYIQETRDRENLLLLLVGDGPERKALEQQVAEQQLENNVVFTGMVSFDHIEDYYALGNIFVSGSTSETQGLTYIEALASGMPLLVRQDDCLEGILQEYQNGIGYLNGKMFQQGLEYLRKNLHKNTALSPDNIQKSVRNLGKNQFANQIELLYHNQMKKQDVRQNEKNLGTTHAA